MSCTLAEEVPPPSECFSTNSHPHVCSGPPQSPGVSVLTPSAVEILLEWGKPFTWPDYDILQYNITEIDSDTELVRMFNTTHLNHSYLSPSGKIATTCKAVTFMVSAVSDLGSSLPAIIKTGLPICEDRVSCSNNSLVLYELVCNIKSFFDHVTFYL